MLLPCTITEATFYYNSEWQDREIIGKRRLARIRDARFYCKSIKLRLQEMRRERAAKAGYITRWAAARKMQGAPRPSAASAADDNVVSQETI